MERNTELEASIINDPDNPDAYLVYADWLQANDDLRGELIIMQHQGKRDEAQAFLEKHAQRLLGALADYTTSFDGMNEPAFQWRLGFIRSARLSFDSNSVDDVEIEGSHEDIHLEQALADLLQHPLGIALEELILPINMLDDGCYFEPLLKVLAEHGAPNLKRLRIGEFQVAGPGGIENDYDYEISWSGIGDASEVWSRLPKLEYLRIQAGLGSSSLGENGDRLGTMHLPNLRHLEIVTGGMGRECLRSVANAQWPALETMEVWLGSSNYGFVGAVEDLAPILDGTSLPRLRRLGLLNTELSDELCAKLGSAKVLPQLESLDLSYGTMSDEGAALLVSDKTSFAHLEHLALDANYLTDVGVSVVAGLCAEVTTLEQKEVYDDDEDGRYVSLAE